MRQDFTGVEAQSHVDFDSVTTTPTYSIDFTAGANFNHDRGNLAVSMGLYESRRYHAPGSRRASMFRRTAMAA